MYMNPSYLGYVVCKVIKVEYSISYIFLSPLVFTCLQYKPVEYTVEKGGIAQNEQFVPFPTMFSTLL